MAEIRFVPLPVCIFPEYLSGPIQTINGVLGCITVIKIGLWNDGFRLDLALSDRSSSGQYIQVSFQHTLRILDDDSVYPLPPGLGEFPIFWVEDFEDRVPAQWKEHGGIFIPDFSPITSLLAGYLTLFRPVWFRQVVDTLYRDRLSEKREEEAAPA